MSKSLGANSTTEVLRLRKELIQAKSEISDLHDELEEKTNQYLNAIKSRNAYKEKLDSAADNINRVQDIVQSKVTQALGAERKELQLLKEENEKLKHNYESVRILNEDFMKQNKDNLDKIQSLQQDVEAFAQNNDVREVMRKCDRVRLEKEQMEKENVELMHQLNKLTNLIEDFTAENRTLRQMAQVPDNYGIKLEEIKLHNKEKIEDFRKLIKILQDDNYKLEEERAKLKHALKLQQTLSEPRDPSQYFKHLTDEQKIQVNNYALRLVQGNAIEPSDYYQLKKENEDLKHKISALESSGFQTIALQLKNMLMKNGGLMGDEKNPNPLQKLLQDNEEIRMTLQKLLEQGINVDPNFNTTHGATLNKTSVYQYGSFRPPVPIPDFDGSIQRGMSYRFDHSHLNVADHNGAPMTTSNPYEQAFLQLQVQEMIELNKRKDETLESQKDQIEKLYGKIKDYLLIQDQLYKDFTTVERNFQRKEKQMNDKMKKMEELLATERLTSTKYEDTQRAIASGNKDTINARIVDLTKQNAINDVNLMKMSRKYSALHEQWKLLSREYHSQDGDLADKDVFVQQRINSLKKWKTEALLQLRLLFDKLKVAVSVSEYDEVSRQLNIQRLKNNVLQDKQMQQNTLIMQLQKQQNKNKEDEMDLKLSLDVKRNLEQEIEILTKRLERHDPIFKWENQIFHKIAQIFIRAKVRPDQVFAEFDKNGDGILQKQEFSQVIEKVLQRTTGEGLSNNELEILWEALDINRNQLIDLKEFAYKLERFGLKVHTREEHIIYQLIEAVQRSTSIKDIATFFTLIDSKGRGFITRDDFADLFIAAKLKIDEKELTNFMNQFWKDDKAAIDYEGFLRIFKKYQVKLDDENRQKDVGKFVPINEETLRLKKHYFDEINQVLKQKNLGIKDLFRKADSDGSHEMQRDELFAMFKNMRLQMTKEQSDQIFSSIDFDNSGRISMPEIQADFQKVVSKEIADLIYEQKSIQRLAEAERKDTQAMDYGIDQILKGEHKTSQLMTRIEILTAKNTSLQKRLEHSALINNNIQQNCLAAEQQYLDLVKSNEDLMIQKIEYQEEIDTLKIRQNNTISKENFQQIMQEREKLIEDLTSTRAAMLSYKKMTEVIAEQAKNIKFMHERKKDEHENLLQALREMQSESATKDRIGKLYFIIMLSRWQEAAVNKKYSLVLCEVKNLRGELLSSDAHNTELQNKSNEQQEEINKGFTDVSKLNQKVESLRAVYITQGRADELARNYLLMCEDRTDLEIKLMKVRDDLRNENDKVEGLTVAKTTAERMYQDLRHGQNEDICKRLIEMSNNFQQMKLKEYRLERSNVDLTQKVDYYTRLLNQRNEAIFVLEEKAAKSEADMFKEREEFRTRDNERKEQLFNYNRYANGRNQVGLLSESTWIDPISHRTAGRQNVSINDQLDQAVKRTDTSVHRLGQDQLQRDLDLRKMDQQPIYERKYTADWTKPHIADGDSTRRIQTLEDQVKSLMNQIGQKQMEIDSMGKWQLGDQYLSQDDQLKDKIEEYKVRMSAHQEKDTQEMADAAYQTVQTLQNLLEQKKELLKSKDVHMQKLRDQMEEQRKIDADVISKLREQLAITGNSTLSKLHQAATRMETQGAHTTQGQRQANADLNIHDRRARDTLNSELDKKDRLIKKLELQLTNYESSSKEFAAKLADKSKQIEALRQEILQLKDKSDLERATAARNKLMATIKQRDEQIKNLSKAIDTFKDKMIEYEGKELDHNEENIILEKKDRLEIKRLKDELEQEVKLKKKAIETKTSQYEEMTRLKSQIDKLSEEIKSDKIADAEKDRKIKDLTALLETTKSNLNNVEAKLKELRSKTDASGKQSIASYEQIEQRNSQLEKEVKRLNIMSQPVVAHNKEFGTFEFIGAPTPLEYSSSLSQEKTVYNLVEAIQAWFKENDRISYPLIFKSLDRGNFGDLREEQLISAFKRMGILLTPSEVKLLQEKLDLHNNKLFEISPLIRVLSGVPTKQFLPSSLLSIASIALSKDLTKDLLKKTIDPSTLIELDIDQFKNSVKKNLLNGSDVELTDREIEEMYSFVTKVPRSKFATTKMSVEKFSDQVMFGVNAVIIEAVRQALRRKQVHLIDLLHKHDQDKDGNLTLLEVESFLQELALEIPLGSKLQALFFKEMLDKQNKKRVSCEQMKHVFGEDITMVVQNQMLDLEPSKERQGEKKGGLTSDQYEVARTAARKVLTSFQGRLFEELSKHDPTGSGLINCHEVNQVIERKNLTELQPSELKQLLEYCDSGSHGCLNLSVLDKKLQDLAQETDREKLLRKFSTDTKQLSSSLETMLTSKDPHRTGKLDFRSFKNLMQTLNMQLQEQDIKSLYQEGEEKIGTVSMLDIKYFTNKIAQVQKTPAFVQQQGKPGQAKTQTRFNTQADAPEDTTKFKKSIEALKLEIEEKNREIKSLNQAIADSSKRVLSLENEIKKLENRLVDKHAKPPHEMLKESITQGALDQIQKLKDEIYHVQNVNQALQKTIQVDLKQELSKLAQEKEEVEEKYKLLREQFNNKKLEIERMTGTGGADHISRREQALESRQKRIDELENEIEQLNERSQSLQDQLFVQQEKVLDLKFEKETFDFQFARLQKRITDLEQYKMQSSSLSAALKGKHEEELAIIKDQSTKLSGDSLAQKPGDSVKMRNKSMKSVQDLELVIEMLRRVQDKQKVEIDALKRTNERLTAANAKVGNDAELRIKIGQLERVVHSYEMRDVSGGEQDATIKKLIFANKQLREDMTREIERYNLLESKYRDLLVKNNVITRENDSNKEFVFQIQTGAHMQKYSQFLKDPETPPKNELDTKFGFTGFRTTKGSGFDDSLNKINKEMFE